MTRTIQIGSHPIGPGHPCFVIAEAGVNHNGDARLARQLVDVAADAGAHAVKFQAFRAERLTTPEARKATYQRDNTGTDESQFDMLKSLELDPPEFAKLAEHAGRRGILFLCTAFDLQSVDDLERIGVPAYKVPSGEITNGIYLRHVASKGRPVIVSTGMATLSEIEDAVAALRGGGVEDLVLLQCTTNYPTAPEQANLRVMATLSQAFGVPAGYSDHTAGTDITLAAAAPGACVIEKHFTLDRNLPGPDHKASLEPGELQGVVRSIRDIRNALGDGVKRPNALELEIGRQVRRSLVLASPLVAGQVIDASVLDALRPATGIPPSLMAHVVGRKARRALPAGTMLSWEDLA